jgi:steroid delta-isomerase-like uncharacterized protein
MGVEQNKEFVRRALVGEVWNNGNLATVDEVFAPNYRGHDPDRPGLDGPEAVKRSVAEFHTAFPDFAISIDDLIAEGDRVVWRYTMTGTHNAPFLGAPPCGRRIAATGISIFRIDGGVLREGWINFDALGMLRQFGALPLTPDIRRTGVATAAPPAPSA